MSLSDASTSAPNDAAHFGITRLLNVPRELAFAAWTEEEHLRRWFAPRDFTIPVCRLNLVPGGIFHYCMRASNGVEMWGKWTFREIVAPERLVFVNTFSNRHGNPTRHPYVAEWPLEILTTATFENPLASDKTLVGLDSIPIDATPAEQKTFARMHAAMIQGWNGTFDQLAAYLATL